MGHHGARHRGIVGHPFVQPGEAATDEGVLDFQSLSPASGGGELPQRLGSAGHLLGGLLEPKVDESTVALDRLRRRAAAGWMLRRGGRRLHQAQRRSRALMGGQVTCYFGWLRILGGDDLGHGIFLEVCGSDYPRSAGILRRNRIGVERFLNNDGAATKSLK